MLMHMTCGAHTPGHSSAADEAWYWPKHVVEWLTSRNEGCLQPRFSDILTYTYNCELVSLAEKRTALLDIHVSTMFHVVNMSHMFSALDCTRRDPRSKPTKEETDVMDHAHSLSSTHSPPVHTEIETETLKTEEWRRPGLKQHMMWTYT